MRYDADEEVAMILPLPAALPAGGNSIRFLSLKDYASFFDDMDKGFPQPAENFGPGPFGGSPSEETLKMESVGNFDASFVPTIRDFERLDPRFRIPEPTWGKLPDYHDFSFAVFQLKADAKTVHPIAFEFATRLPEGELFFPTVHIHDGEVHETADYDHTLYQQGGQPRGQTRLRHEESPVDDLSWAESRGIPVQFMQAGRAAGTVDPRLHIYRLSLKGKYLNRDFHTVQRIG